MVQNSGIEWMQETVTSRQSTTIVKIQKNNLFRLAEDQPFDFGDVERHQSLRIAKVIKHRKFHKKSDVASYYVQISENFTIKFAN